MHAAPVLLTGPLVVHRRAQRPEGSSTCGQHDLGLGDEFETNVHPGEPRVVQHPTQLSGVG
jgi:hypothetical protein